MAFDDPSYSPEELVLCVKLRLFGMTKTCHKLKFKFCALTAPSIALEQKLPSYISYVKFGIAALWLQNYKAQHHFGS